MARPACAASVLLCFALAAVAGCATYEQELQRAEDHFTHDEHERSLATLRALEEDWASLSTKDRARYAYLRGMTDYRIGFKADARHWLAVGLEIERDSPGALAADEKKASEEKLGELNAVVWAGDVLPQDEAPGKAAKKAKPKEKAPDEDAADDEASSKKKGDGEGKAKKKDGAKGDAKDEDSESSKSKKNDAKGEDGESSKSKKKSSND